VGEIVPLFEPQNRSRVLKRIKKLWEQGNFEMTDHAQARMLERGLDVHDIHHIIEHGRISEIGRPHFLWRYTVVGKTVECKPAACIVEINGQLIIITAVDLTSPRKKKRKGEPL
jgi:hypothetical protein